MAEETFNIAADKLYGSFCCLCFVVGTTGYIISFLHFKSKKRNISSVIYMLITASDILVSVAMLPRGLSYLSGRKPGILFGDKYGCEVSFHSYVAAQDFSVFLATCLSISRTISLLYPFRRQKVKHLFLAVSTFLLATLVKTVGVTLYFDMEAEFDIWSAFCGVFIYNKLSGVTVKIISTTILFIIPIFVVAISGVISLVLLTRRNRNVKQKELQQSRNRATVTILLFALIFEICNVFFAVYFFLLGYSFITDNSNLFDKVFKFDKTYYFRQAIFLLCAGNSAANPVLYFSRIPSLKEKAIGSIRRFVRCIIKLPRFDVQISRIDRRAQRPDENIVRDNRCRDDNIGTCSCKCTIVETRNL